MSLKIVAVGVYMTALMMFMGASFVATSEVQESPRDLLRIAIALCAIATGLLALHLW